ncbi:hypothetical protein P8452_68826 [Trifolium repens]|nr:hypothetical protein P8452_68826 [Trifolium repens]
MKEEFGVLSDILVSGRQYHLDQDMAHSSLKHLASFMANPSTLWATMLTSKTGAVHENCINSIMRLGEREILTRRFSTSGLHGRIVVWDLENEQDLLEL